MDSIYIAYEFSVSPRNPATEILIAELGHVGFESFVGIDWSGAAGTGHSNIQIARCEVGSSCPKIVQNPRGSVWSRCDLLDWITAEVAQSKVLIGCDFAFGFRGSGDCPLNSQRI